MKQIIAVALGLALVACSAGGPSKDDIEQAMGDYFEQAAGVRPVFEDLEVGKCEKAGEGPGHACSVCAVAVLTTRMRTQREPLSRTFVLDEVGGEWKVVATR